MRVGRQPYGVLPVSSLGRWVARDGERAAMMINLLRNARRRWLAAAEGLPRVRRGRGGLDAQMLEAMGDHYAVFLKGHGIVVLEQTIEGNAVSAIRLERASRDQILLSSFSQPRALADGARGRIRSRMDHPYRIWPYLLYQHGIMSRKEAKRLTRSMMKNIWPDEVK